MITRRNGWINRFCTRRMWKEGNHSIYLLIHRKSASSIRQNYLAKAELKAPDIVHRCLFRRFCFSLIYVNIQDIFTKYNLSSKFTSTYESPDKLNTLFRGPFLSINYIDINGIISYMRMVRSQGFKTTNGLHNRRGIYFETCIQVSSIYLVLDANGSSYPNGKNIL